MENIVKQATAIDISTKALKIAKKNAKFFNLDQINFKIGNNNKKKFKKGDIIYWKGHVALCVNSKKLIHAYGPKKKVLVMDINKTISLIKKTENLEVKKIFRI